MQIQKFSKKIILQGFGWIFVLALVFHAFKANGQFVAEPVTPTENPVLQKSFFDSFLSITNVLFVIVLIASLIGFVLAGVMFIISGGSEGMIEKAHKTWIASLVGLFSSLTGYIVVNIFKYFIQ